MDFLIRIKRIYDPPAKEDCFRILVDRLWPRGMSKAKAHLDLWLKEIAPSDKLRQWFSHEPEKWAEFKEEYLKELALKEDLVVRFKQLEKGTITLIYSAKDVEHNNAVALRNILEKSSPST